MNIHFYYFLLRNCRLPRAGACIWQPMGRRLSSLHFMNIKVRKKTVRLESSTRPPRIWRWPPRRYRRRRRWRPRRSCRGRRLWPRRRRRRRRGRCALGVASKFESISSVNSNAKKKKRKTIHHSKKKVHPDYNGRTSSSRSSISATGN